MATLCIRRASDVLHPVPLRLTPDLREWLDRKRHAARLSLNAAIRQELLRAYQLDISDALADHDA